MAEGPPPGRLIADRYQLGELVARGGMADVYKGRDTVLGRVVALKFQRIDLTGEPDFRARFTREAQVAVSLNHPAIVATYDVGEARLPSGSGPAQQFLVQEYVAGQTLRTVLAEDGPLPPERALEIVAGVLDALDYAHGAGIVHRDIKPGNVMLTETGAVKVMDFGIAVAMSDAVSTATTAVVGTAQYLSPEQAVGESVDSRSDLYSAGCVLYELLTGRPPFTGDSPVAVAYQHVREPAAPPSVYRTDLTPEIDAIVMKSLAKRVEDRYQTAAEMRSDIERLLAGEEIRAGQKAGEPELTTRVRETSHALSLVDGIYDVDAIGRGPLTEHLADVIVRMINRCRIDPTAPETLVIGVDAPWGSGKTTLVHLLSHGLASRSAGVGKPLVVNFDAWRESKVGPEWWALGATLYRGVRRERAVAAQAAMIMWSALGRLARSKVFVGAVALLAVYAVFLSDSSNQALVARWQTVISAVTAAVAGAFGVSRLLFWSSPALGALYQKSDDAPLAEIAGMISRQRRWSPRSTRSQRVADSLLGVWVLLVLCLGLWLAWADDRSASTFALIGCLALVGVGSYGLFVGRVLSVPKRPIIFVVDDLDRCTDEKTVAYLETIHTLVRHHERPRWFQRWRQPAPLIIIVLADGRWVRNAFAKAYETFADVSGDETRGLGADFIQKLFDHTVIIPELTLTQASEYVRQLTESDVAGDTSEAEVGADGSESQESDAQTGAEETARAAQGIAEATGAANLDQLERSASQFPDAEADALRSAISIERSSEEYVLELTRHLMTKYSRHMPQNPRMIKRVANAWSMLQAVQLSIGSHKTERELVAAAIFMTKYPNLVDQLLHHPTVPEDEGPWQRVDVMETRSLVSDPTPGLIDLAACYGKALLPARPPGNDPDGT